MALKSTMIRSTMKNALTGESKLQCFCRIISQMDATVAKINATVSTISERGMCTKAAKTAMSIETVNITSFSIVPVARYISYTEKAQRMAVATKMTAGM